MGASLIVVGIMFERLGTVSVGAHASGPTTDGVITLVGLIVFIASFAFSLGPVVWTIINEVYPTHIRSRAVAVATAANWFAAWLVAQFFLSLVGLITEAGTFWLFAGFCALTFLFVRFFVPETKGKSLEEVEGLWADTPAGGLSG
jgi:SP family galactose:H+ symporter-like MFS transporter